MHNHKEDKSSHKPVISDKAADYFGHDVVEFIDRNVNFRADVLVVGESDCDFKNMNFIEKFFRKAQLEEHFSKAGLVHGRDEICELADAGDVSYSVSSKSQRYVDDPFHGEGSSRKLETTEDPSHVIVVSKRDDPSQIFSEISGVPQENISNIPGTGKDWRTLSLFHEITHHSEDHEFGYDVPMWKELEADEVAKELYKQAYQEGIVSDPRVPHAKTAGRTIDYMMFPDRKTGSHDLAVLARSDKKHDPSAAGVSPVQAAQKIDEAKNAVYTMIGLDLVTEEEMESRDGSNLDDIALKRGMDTAWEQPGLVYETARQMYQRGEFRENPAGETMIENFIQAAEMYAPAHFETDDRMTIPPPVFQTLPDPQQQNPAISRSAPVTQAF